MDAGDRLNARVQANMPKTPAPMPDTATVQIVDGMEEATIPCTR